eukprot:TRINITY_DN82426_c0_g1_i1.p1 TRINITY_DN82426_c0_g1~~TRINITY_DN82426_c0_g1_i1.p1  ORF type:complete len:165 (-),score=52.93 TRINITY_DN82426_c0_g1_i1:231-725(-)
MSSLKVKTNDGIEFTIDEETASCSGLLKGIMDEFGPAEDGSMNTVDLKEVDSKSLERVIEFRKIQKTLPVPVIEKPLPRPLREILPDQWNAFLEMPEEELNSTIRASNYLDVDALSELLCAYVADIFYFQCGTPEKIRERFHIENDFTPEEEARVIEASKWCKE